MLVKNWKDVMLQSWAVRAAAAGIALPELAQLVLANLASLPLSADAKEWVRIVCLVLVILLRPVNQDLQPDKAEGQ
jgi:hypothetical protein